MDGRRWAETVGPTPGTEPLRTGGRASVGESYLAEGGRMPWDGRGGAGGADGHSEGEGGGETGSDPGSSTDDVPDPRPILIGISLPGRRRLLCRYAAISADRRHPWWSRTTTSIASGTCGRRCVECRFHAPDVVGTPPRSGLKRALETGIGAPPRRLGMIAAPGEAGVLTAVPAHGYTPGHLLYAGAGFRAGGDALSHGRAGACPRTPNRCCCRGRARQKGCTVGIGERNPADSPKVFSHNRGRQGVRPMSSDDVSPRDALMSGAMFAGTMMESLGIVVVEATREQVVMTMPVTDRSRQPFGLLHGGASVALAESAASLGTWLYCDPQRQRAVGIEINANHIRAKRDGLITATAVPLHRGRTTMVWDIRLKDEEDRLVSVARCTVGIVPNSPRES